MATSGTTSFSLPLDELLEQATLRVGGEPTLGTEARVSRRALDLLFTDLQNRGILLHTLEQVLVTLTSAVATISCSADTLDILDAVVRRNDTDLMMTRLGFGEYLDIPRKDQAGRPTHFFVNRQRDNPLIYLWPAPENSTDILVFWKMRFVQDAGRLSNDPDMPRRFWPALVAGLAYYLALNRGMQFPMDRLAMLKAEFEEQLSHASDEDRERATLRIVPRYRY
jgi:hypothetical protein